MFLFLFLPSHNLLTAMLFTYFFFFGLGFEGAKNNGMVEVEESFNQMRWWNDTTTSDEYHQQQLYGLYPHYPQQYLMAMQKPNNQIFYSFSNSSLSTTTSHVIGNREKVVNSDTPPDAVSTPIFFDFLGVGAT